MALRLLKHSVYFGDSSSIPAHSLLNALIESAIFSDSCTINTLSGTAKSSPLHPSSAPAIKILIFVFMFFFLFFERPPQVPLLPDRIDQMVPRQIAQVRIGVRAAGNKPTSK